MSSPFYSPYRDRAGWRVLPVLPIGNGLRNMDARREAALASFTGPAAKTRAELTYAELVKLQADTVRQLRTADADELYRLDVLVKRLRLDDCGSEGSAVATALCDAVGRVHGSDSAYNRRQMYKTQGRVV